MNTKLMSACIVAGTMLLPVAGYTSGFYANCRKVFARNLNIGQAGERSTSHC